jgi:very-short-patch-repair endonuclease
MRSGLAMILDLRGHLTDLHSFPRRSLRSRCAAAGIIVALWPSPGRFRLNAELPIPFDNLGRMEVDLLCSDARLAIELDGSQHLESTDAYRRDRRKDQLLQQNGFFALRFLAEDVGKNLDVVMDTIQRTLFSRQKQ